MEYNLKFNKNVILYQLREMSGLTTKEIRASLKPYKNIYKDIDTDNLSTFSILKIFTSLSRTFMQ